MPVRPAPLPSPEDSQKFFDNLERLAETSAYLAVKDGTIIEVSLFKKITSVTGGLLGIKNDNTSAEKIDAVLKKICVENKGLSQQHIKQIQQLALHAGLVKPSYSRNHRSNEYIRGASESVNQVADFLNESNLEKFGHDSSLAPVLSLYHKKNMNLDEFSKKLEDPKTRVAFEKWLLENLSGAGAAHANFTPLNSVICLLIQKSSETKTDPEISKLEASLLANIIAKSAPLNKKNNPKSLDLDPADLPSMAAVFLQRFEHDKLVKLVLTLVKENNSVMLRAVVEKSPKAFKEAWILAEKSGYTLVHHATRYGHDKVVQSLFDLVSKEDFLKALTTQNNTKGATPMHLAAWAPTIDALKVIKNLISEEEFIQISKICDKIGDNIYAILKVRRLEGYKDITQLATREIKNVNKHIASRKALGHMGHIGGKSKIFTKNTKTSTVVDLEGYLSEAWFNIFKQDLMNFKTNYSNALEEVEFAELEEALSLAGNLMNPKDEDKANFERILAGKPTFLKVGFKGHAVTLFVWGDQMAICNRGGATRKPIEFFHFDPAQLTLDHLTRLRNIQQDTRSAYKKLFFETLPKELKFYQSPQDLELEQDSTKRFKLQTVGNCSLVSPITSLYAFKALKEVRGIDSEGKLLETENTDMPENLKKANDRYQEWLIFEHILFLEKAIKPLEAPDSKIQPDHKLICEYLRKVYLWKPDGICTERLDACLETYFKYLNESECTQLKSDLVYWKAGTSAPFFSKLIGFNAFSGG